MPPRCAPTSTNTSSPRTSISALSRRTQAPRITNGQLHIAGEPPSAFDPADHDPATRTTHDRIVIALSSALGIEGLPADEAEPLLDAFNHGILELGEPFALWGAVGIDTPRAADVDDLLDAGAVGDLAARRGARATGAACATSRRCSTAWRRAGRRSSSTPGPACRRRARRRPAGGPR